jgi:hypothetical protein
MNYDEVAGKRRPLSLGNLPMADATPRADYDSPWKQALAEYFEAFLLMFFPQVHAEIDWSRGYEILDKELQQLAPEAETGRRVADLLFRVWRRNGEEKWVLIHVEVQSQPDPEFPHRMFVYNSRFADRHKRLVASFAILADGDPIWRPDRYVYNLWNCGGGFHFPVVQLLDLDTAELEQKPNPFAVVVLAHLTAQRTAGDAQSRRASKFRLIRGLLERSIERENVLRLLRLLDWFLKLPPPIEYQLRQDVQAFEQEKRMPYVTSWERMGKEEGLAEGLAEGEARGLRKAIALLLGKKFGESGRQLMPEIEKIQDVAMLSRIIESIESATSVDEIRQVWKP